MGKFIYISPNNVMIAIIVQVVYSSIIIGLRNL